MKRGFTMIELIFVIVIIGILAVIAIPKLNATRDDAKVSTEIQNITTCLQDAGSAFTGTGKESDSSNACQQLVKNDCVVIDLIDGGSDTDGNVTVKAGGNGDQWCTLAQDKATARGLLGAAGAKKIHEFGGSHIKD